MIPRTRRQFVQDLTMGTAAALLASRVQPLAAQTASASQWRSRIGLELYTVRDLLEADYEGTLAKVADMGYTEVEPTSYNNMAPKDFRAMLDGYKLTMPSTHAPARGAGADLERQLEGFQVMGIKYTEIAAAGQRGAGRRGSGSSAACDAFHRAGTTTPVPDESATPSKKPRPSDPIRRRERSSRASSAPDNSTRTARLPRSTA